MLVQVRVLLLWSTPLPYRELWKRFMGPKTEKLRKILGALHSYSQFPKGGGGGGDYSGNIRTYRGVYQIFLDQNASLILLGKKNIFKIP